MNNIDEEIRKALTQEDQKTMEAIDKEGGIFDLIGLSFSGPQAWLTYYMYAIGFLAFFAGVYLYVQFASTTDLKMGLAYTIGIMICVSILVTIKIIGWQNMQRLELLREIKRLEMRMMLLSEKNESS